MDWLTLFTLNSCIYRHMFVSHERGDCSVEVGYQHHYFRMSNPAMSGFVQPKNTHKSCFFNGCTHENLDHSCSRSSFVRDTFFHLSMHVLKLEISKYVSHAQQLRLELHTWNLQQNEVKPWPHATVDHQFLAINPASSELSSWHFVLKCLHEITIFSQFPHEFPWQIRLSTLGYTNFHPSPWLSFASHVLDFLDPWRHLFEALGWGDHGDPLRNGWFAMENGAIAGFCQLKMVMFQFTIVTLLESIHL